MYNKSKNSQKINDLMELGSSKRTIFGLFEVRKKSVVFSEYRRA